MRRQRERTLDPRAERELAALERGLAGEPVDADLAEWAELARLLAAERPAPRADWAERLDARVASRFRDRGAGRGNRVAAGIEGRGTEGVAVSGAGPTAEPAAAPSRARRLGALWARLRGALAGRSPLPLAGAAVLLVVVAVAAGTLRDGPGGTGGPAGPETAGEQATKEASPTLQANGSTGGSRAGGDLWTGTAADAQRRIQRDAQLTLSTTHDRVRDVADEVISTTRSLDGIVASSRTTERGRRASASLALTIPAANLDAALDRLTSLAHVESMSEGSLDITQPFDSARDRLRDARAERARLLDALGTVSGEEEAVQLRKQIAAARRRVSRARSQVASLSRRSRYAQLSVTVRGTEGAGAQRSLSDWLRRALDVLRAVAGVILVSAAILIPLALLGTLAWLTGAAIRRRRRERALDDQPS